MKTQLKHLLRKIIPTPLIDYYRRSNFLFGPMIQEINKLGIRDFGVENGLGYLRLADDTILYGPFQGEEFNDIFASVQHHLHPALNREAFELATHVITHYVYPVPMPAWTPPYSLRSRRCFGRFACDTILDFPELTSTQKTISKSYLHPRKVLCSSIVVRG